AARSGNRLGREVQTRAVAAIDSPASSRRWTTARKRSSWLIPRMRGRIWAMKIGMLTGGGDCPGLNAVIRAVGRFGGAHANDTFLGYRHGWRGASTGDSIPLSVASTRGLIARGGTILGTSRTNPFKDGGTGENVLDTLRSDGVDALVAIGGDDTLGVAAKLA